MNAGLAALGHPHKCYNDWHIPLAPLPPAGGAEAGVAAAEGAGAGAGDRERDAGGGGWRYVEVEREGGREIRKRGWLATAAGARARVRVNTAWGGLGIDPAALVEVSLGRAAPSFSRLSQLRLARRSERALFLRACVRACVD